MIPFHNKKTMTFISHANMTKAKHVNLLNLLFTSKYYIITQKSNNGGLDDI